MLKWWKDLIKTKYQLLVFYGCRVVLIRGKKCQYKISFGKNNKTVFSNNHNLNKYNFKDFKICYNLLNFILIN